MGRKLPKGCRDWHEDLIRCAEARYNRRAHEHRKDHSQWMMARDLLRESQDHVFIQPTGDNKHLYPGAVIGIPKKIGPAITQYLHLVVREEKPVIAPEDEAFMNNIVQVVGQNGQQLNAGCPGAADLGFERGPWVENRRYRDSAYAVLAAMYSLLRPDVHHLVKTAQIEAEMRHFTDHDIRFDYRNRKQGAFKAMDQLVKWNLVYKQRGIGFGGGNSYSLTQRGLKVCYQLFHVKFTPEVSAAYVRVHPRGGQCEANAEGQIQLVQGGQPVGQPVGQLVAVGPRQQRVPQLPLPGGGGGVAGAGGGAPWGGGGGNRHGFAPLGLGVFDHGGEVGHWDDDEDDDLGHLGGFGGGAHMPPHSGRKRPLGDLYGGAEYDGRYGAGYGAGYGADGAAEAAAEYALDPDHVRRKRLQKFEAAIDGARGSSSSAVKEQVFGAGVKAEDFTGGATVSDSQDPELEVVRLQTLLEYSEVEAAREARRRQEEQALEEMQMQLALEDSDRAARREEEDEQELLRLQAEYAGIEDDEQSVYDLDYEPPVYADGTDGLDAEHYGSDEEEEDEDYRRAVQESLQVQHQQQHQRQHTAHMPATNSEVVARTTTSTIPVAASVATPATSHRRGTTSASTATGMTGRPLPEVIDLDGVGEDTPCAVPAASAPMQATPRQTGPTQRPSRAAVNLHNREVVDITGTEGSSNAQPTAAPTLTETPAHPSHDPDVLVLDATEAAASLRKVTARRRANSLGSQDTQGTSRSRVSAPRTTTGPTMAVTVPTQRSTAVNTPPLSPLIEELSSGTPQLRRSGHTSAPPTSRASARQSAQAPHPREVICLDESQSQSQSQSQVMAEICSEEVEWLGLSGEEGSGGCIEWRRTQLGGEITAGATDGAGGTYSRGSNSDARNSQDRTNGNITGAGTGRGLGVAMLAAFAAQQHAASTPSVSQSARGTLPTTPPTRGPSTSPQRVALPRIPTTALAVSPSGPSRGALSCPIPFSTITNPVHRQLIMLVDTRERKEEKRYRQFFFDIKQRCTNHLPPSPFVSAASPRVSSTSGAAHPLEWHIEQEELALGDVAFAFDVPDMTVGAGAAHGSQQVEHGERYLTGTIVERKALGDLISSSAGDTRERRGTARHVTQERRLRHSGLSHPFMLIEGITNVATLHTAPLVWRDDDRSNPDVIATPEGIVSYMAAVVVRNYAPQRRVTVLQTMNNGTTAVLYAALMAVELYRAAAGSTARGISGTLLADFEKYCTSLGGDKRGQEALLRRDLLLSAPPTAWVALSSSSSSSSSRTSSAGLAVLAVGVEIVERIVRRFGTWDALLDAYRLCYSTARPLFRSVEGTALAEMRCALLLCELTVGGTCLDRDHLTAAPGSPAMDAPSTQGEGLSRWESALVWLTARQRLVAQGFLPAVDGSHGDGPWAGYLYSALRGAQPRKITRVDLSGSMIATYMSGHSALDRALFTVDAQSSVAVSPQRGKASAILGGSGSYLNHSDRRNPCMHLQTVDVTEYALSSQEDDGSGDAPTAVLRRRSQLLCVAVVSGYDVVEELVRATDAYLAALPGQVTGNIFADPAHSIPIVRSALSGLSRRLPGEFASSRCITSGVPAQCVVVAESLVHPTSAMASAVGRLSRAVNNTGSQDSVTVRLGEGRSDLPARAAREVSANEVWLVQLFLACASMFGPSTAAGSGGADGSDGAGGAQTGLSEGSGAANTGTATGWQCLLSPSAEQTERLLYALVHETHRQALLLF